MPIPILQYGVKVRDPTTQQFSDLAALRGGQGPQGPTGPGVPAGGTDGDVLVKNGDADYAGTWTKTPPQMGNLAMINTGSTAVQDYDPGAYLVYNGQLYKVGSTRIMQGNPLTPGGNIAAVNTGNEIKVLNDKNIVYRVVTSISALNTFVQNNTVLLSFTDLTFTPSAAGWYKIGTLPALLRPTTWIVFPGINNQDDTMLNMRAETNGEIYVYVYSNKVNVQHKIRANVTYFNHEDETISLT